MPNRPLGCLESLAAAAGPVLSAISRAARRIDHLGWAEARAGNLSWRLETVAGLPGPVAGLNRPVPALASRGLLISAAGTRMCDLAEDPLPGLCLVGFNRDGTGYSHLGEHLPSSELPAHIAVHAALTASAPEHRALVHAHPAELVALGLLLPEPEALLAALARALPEAGLLRGRAAVLPFITPGSDPLAEATGKAFERHMTAVWQRHGAIASGTTFAQALDLIETLNKAARVGLLAYPGVRGGPSHVPRTGQSSSRASRGQRLRDGDETFHQVRSHDSELPPAEFARLARRPVHIVLENLRSAFNVGSVFRLADAARVQEVITCGYTAHPPHPKLEQTGLGTTASVPRRHCDTAAEVLGELSSSGVQLVAVETAEHAVPYHRFEYRLPTALVFGNEAHGLSQSVLRVCDGIVDIPVFGFKNSINVAAAVAVVLYDLSRRFGWLDSNPVTAQPENRPPRSPNQRPRL